MQKLGCLLLPRERHKNHLQAGPSRIFHGRYAIRIIGDQDDALHSFGFAKICYVEADAHIDTLLLEIRVKILIGKRLFRQWRCLRFKAPEFKNAQPHSKQIFTGQATKPTVLAAQDCLIAGNRQADLALKWRAVVIEDPEHLFTVTDAMRGDLLDVIRVITKSIFANDNA